MARKVQKPVVVAPPPAASTSDELLSSSDDEQPPVQSIPPKQTDSSSTEEEEEDEEETPVSPSTTKKTPTQKNPDPSESESETDSDSPPAKVKPIESKPMDLKKSRPVTVLASPAAKRRGGSDSNEKGTTSKKAKVEKVEGGSHDESKKPMFQRIWNDNDEIEILKGLIEYRIKMGVDPMANSDGFLEFVKKSLHVDVNKVQIMSKVRALKKRFENAKKKTKIVDPHGLKLFMLSKKVWEDANGAVSNGTKESNSKAKMKKAAVVENSKVANGSVVSEEKEEEDDEEEDEEELQDWVISRREKEKLKLEGLGNSLFSTDRILKEGMNLLDAEEKAKLSKKWKKHNLEEMELFVKKLDLLKELTQKTVNAMKSAYS